jgi:DNA helicase-2/ATP-dependent DNA helicase PcrA
LLRRHIPYRVVGSLKFYEREEVKDALALLSFLVNPRDEVAFRRVVNKPARGAGAATVDRVVGEASLADGDLAAAARRIMADLPAKARSGLIAFLDAIAAGASALLPDVPPDEAVLPDEAGEAPDEAVPPDSAGEVLDEAGLPDSAGEAPDEASVPSFPRTVDAGPVKKGGSTKAPPRGREGLSSGEGLSVCVVRLILEAGIAEYHISHDEIAGNQRIANLQELANAASLYPATRPGLLEFLAHIELDRSMESSGEASDDVVTLITLHNTKGLEFRRVIMTGIEQGVFPRDDKQDDDLEEERRLFYVGATRAMDELYLTSCALRRVFGRTMPMEPSIFLREADHSSLRILGNAPYGFASSDRRPSGPGAVFPPKAAGSPASQKGSSDGRWHVGDRLFHDDHGYGAVAEIRETGDGPVIRVKFETGHEVRFLSTHQSSRFTKIGND